MNYEGQNVTEDTLFLHLGPGGSAYVERVLLKEFHPNVNFWDQPNDSVIHWNDLLKETEKKMLSLTQIGAQPIALWAHSFGCHLAKAMIEKHPQKIKSALFYSPCWNVPRGIYKLLKKMISEKQKTTLQLLDPGLEEMFNKYSSESSTPTVDDFWKIVTQVAKDPEYLKHYFSSANAFSKYNEISQKGPQINENQFFSITSDFLSTPLDNSTLNWKGEIQIHLGEQDPLIDPKKESLLWKKVFPQALIHILPNKGHFTHLEEFLS